MKRQINVNHCPGRHRHGASIQFADEARRLIRVETIRQTLAFIADRKFMNVIPNLITNIDAASAMLGSVGDEFVDHQPNWLDACSRYSPFVTLNLDWRS